MRNARTTRVTRAARWALVSSLVALVAGCQSIRVYSDHDPSISFVDMQTFAWLEPPRVEGANPFADNDLLRKRLRHTIELRLVARGYRLVEEADQADFLATASVVLEERIRDDGSVSFGYGGYYRYGYGGVYASPGVRNYQESTLIIDVVDPKSMELIWRGWGSGVVGTRDRNRSEERLENGVRQILERFPPDAPEPPRA